PGQQQQGQGRGGVGGEVAVRRMYALLVLARLASQSPECQMDAVREGALPPLLLLAARGGPQERAHSCRLLALLGQAAPTHGRFKELGVVEAVLPLLRWPPAAPHPAHHAPGGDPGVGEHAASVLAVLAHNPDMHFHMVSCGVVPALLPLLANGTSRSRGYALACLLLLSEGDQRHAAVVARAGALQPLLRLAEAVAEDEGAEEEEGERVSLQAAAAAADGSPIPRAGGSSRKVQEFAAAVLCSLSRYLELKTELAQLGALPPLLSCLSGGSQLAATYAAEALVHLAAGEAGAKRHIAAHAPARSALQRLLRAGGPGGTYWALQLLRTLSTE
ncbi:hypothetical protein Agub_g16028, partial [Astrephomene gubernaculifera]